MWGFLENEKEEGCEIFHCERGEKIVTAKKTMIYKGKRWTRIGTRMSLTGAEALVEKQDTYTNSYRITGSEGEYHIWEYKPKRAYPRINVGGARTKKYVHELKRTMPRKKKSKKGREGRARARALYDYPR